MTEMKNNKILWGSKTVLGPSRQYRYPAMCNVHSSCAAPSSHLHNICMLVDPGVLSATVPGLKPRSYY